MLVESNQACFLISRCILLAQRLYCVGQICEVFGFITESFNRLPHFNLVLCNILFRPIVLIPL